MNKVVEETEALTEKLGNIVPEFYYDLIGRIVPGTILLAITHIALTGTIVPLNSDKICETAAVIVGVALLMPITYAIGIILTPFHYFLQLLFSSWEPHLLRVTYPDIYDKRLTVEKSKFRVIKRRRQIAKTKESLSYEAWRSNARARQLIPKMQAEVQLCNNLVIGLIFIEIYILVWPSKETPAHFGLLLLLLGAICLIAAGNRSWKTFMRYCTFVIESAK